MALDAALAELMTDTVTIAAVSSLDSYGKRTHGTPTTYSACRIQTGNRKVTAPDGQERVAVGRVYLPNAPTVTINDRLLLPGNVLAPIIAVDEFHDEQGTHHTIVHYG
jgi:hypothetical protein